ncbi:hypothetical protein CDFC105_43922 [Clostridioides difficile]|nr:hypothetical protein CDFC105_43922 [Clostridioides difficile]
MVCFFFLMRRRPQRSTRKESSAASDVYKRQEQGLLKKQLEDVRERWNKSSKHSDLVDGEVIACLLYTSPSPRD